MEKVTFNDELVEIGEYAFSNCNLTSIRIPSSVKTIKTRAFSGCNQIADIKFHGTNQPTCGTDLFEHTTVNTIYVLYD